MAILDSRRRSGVGISTFVSLGNKIDVSTNDLLSLLVRRRHHSGGRTLCRVIRKSTPLYLAGAGVVDP